MDEIDQLLEETGTAEKANGVELDLDDIVDSAFAELENESIETSSGTDNDGLIEAAVEKTETDTPKK